MYVLWEERDLAGTQAMIALVPAIDPRPVYFWINGARILAHDLTAWRLEAAAGDEAAIPALEERLSREQGKLALAHLAAGMTFHPTSVDLWIERANIELTRMRDVDAAVESYRRAWELPHAPYYVARLHGELLRRQGRKAEALDWLVKLHPRLPPNDEGAAADLVLSRIRDLEGELNVPPARAYQPPR
jgi:hypothetical protein